MKVLIPRDNLKEAVAGLGRVINPRAPVAILSHVRIDADGDKLSLTGTDLSKTATYVVQDAGSVSGAGSAVVPFEVLQSVAKSAQGLVVEIETTAANEVSLGCSVAGHSTSRRVATPDVADWPELPKAPATKPVDARFLDHVRQAAVFASKDDARPVLKSVYVDVGDKKCHRIVGCDSRRLAAFNSVQIPLEESIVVPTGKFLVWNKLAGDVRIGADKDREVFTLAVGAWTYTSKLTPGEYPRYGQVVPQMDGTHMLELAEEDMALLVKMLPGLPDFAGYKDAVVLRLVPGNVQVYSRDESGAESVIGLERSAYKGEPLKVAVSRHFWRDALQANFRLWEFSDPTSPLLGRLSNEDRHSVHVLMPVRVLDSEVQDAPEAEQAEAPAHEAQPASVPDPVHVQATKKETVPMKKHEEIQPAAEPGALDKVLIAYETAKAAVRQAQTALGDVAICVRDALREQKAQSREIAEVRAGLAKLQTIRV